MSAAHPAVRQRLAGDVAGAAGRRLAADAQHGHHRRQPAATHALRLFPRHRFPLQQARSRAPAARRSTAKTAMLAILGGSDAVHRHASRRISPVALMALDAERGTGQARTADAHACRSRDFHRLPGDTPHIETVLAPGEMITAIARARHAGRAALALSESPRPREFRVRPGRRRRSALDIADGTIRTPASPLGGVGTKPWRLPRGRSGAARQATRAATAARSRAPRTPATARSRHRRQSFQDRLAAPHRAARPAHRRRPEESLHG